MRRRSIAVAVGALAVGAYLLGVFLTARLSSFGGRPLLDVGPTNVPYRWSCPPPALAAKNKQPTSARTSIPLNQTGSDAIVVSTNDIQVNVVLPQSEFPPKQSADSVVMSIKPLCADGFAPLPGPYTARGNVYQVTAAYSPSGGPATHLAAPTQLVLSYPSVPNAATTEIQIFRSTDGKTWTKLVTANTTFLHQAQSDVTSLGYFVVGERPGPSTAPQGSGGSSNVLKFAVVAIIAVAFGVAAWLATGRWAARRAAREELEWRDPEDDLDGGGDGGHR